jgi:hypothetical protein
MGYLSREALNDLIYSAIAFGVYLFEIWLTVTFAAILAIYFTRDHISSFMRVLLIALYTGTAILLTGRWCVAMIHVLHYMNELTGGGMEPFPTPQPFGLIMGFLHLTMFLAGSVATIYFMKTYRGENL